MSESPRRRSGNGGFFAIDRRIWAQVCELGLYEAVAYLVLAQGTSGNNRSTSWSAKSLRTYTGIPFERGKPAIDRLKQNGFIRNGEKHSLSRPRYELLSWAEFVLEAQALHEQKIAQLIEGFNDTHYDFLVNEVRNKALAKPDRRDRWYLQELVKRRILAEQGYGRYSVVECPLIPADPDLIWLPNTIVKGTDKGEDSPVRRLRSAGHLSTLRLLVDLYHAHSLTANGGIDRLVIRQSFDGKPIGEQGLFTIWAFRPNSYVLNPTSDAFKAYEPKEKDVPHPAWESINGLTSRGLLTFVPHLWESDAEQAEIIHAYGIPDCGEKLEIELGEAAHLAASMMALDSRIKAAADEGYVHLAPVKKTFPNVQLIGVGRLRYRPHTAKTSEWLSDLVKSAPMWIQLYRERTEKGRCIKAKLA